MGRDEAGSCATGWGGKDGERKADAVRLCLGVAELYADVYLVKNLSNKLKGRD